MGKTIEKRIADPIDFANEEWSVNNETPSTIITPHGRVSISWTCTTGVMDAKAEATAARIVAYHRACSSMPDPEGEIEAMRAACRAIAGIPGTINQSEWDRKVGEAIRLAKKALGEEVGGG